MHIKCSLFKSYEWQWPHQINQPLLLLSILALVHADPHIPISINTPVFITHSFIHYLIWLKVFLFLQNCIWNVCVCVCGQWSVQQQFIDFLNFTKLYTQIKKYVKCIFLNFVCSPFLVILLSSIQKIKIYKLMDVFVQGQFKCVGRTAQINACNVVIEV